MSKKALLVSLLLFPIFHSSLFSQASSLKNEWRYSLEAEYLAPISRFRRISTTNMHARFGWSIGKKNLWQIGIGATLTHAEGEIRFPNGTHQWRAWNAVAWGLGPFIFIRDNSHFPVKFSLNPELSTGIILYSQRFPQGADFYNFMLRLAASPTYYFPRSRVFVYSSITIMHVSNGQGSGYHNLGYDNLGGSIGVGKFL